MKSLMTTGNPAINARRWKKRIPTLALESHGFPHEVPQDEVDRAILSLPAHFSANLVVDIRDTCDNPTSLRVVSGQATVVGQVCDMLFADTNTQIWVAGFGSGVLPILVQTSPDTTSGNFTDPTSGLSQLPGVLTSGGVFWANSGVYGSGISSPTAVVSGAPLFASGGIDFTMFQRPNRYARLIVTSGTAALTSVPFQAGFLGQKRTTGSGGGTSMQPSSGGINV